MQKKNISLIWLLLLVLALSLVLGLLLDPGTRVATRPAGVYSVQITEICAKNENVIADNDGKYRDYIELYNPGEETDLTGCTLTDGSVSYRLNGLVMGKGEYRLLFLGAETTGFALSASGRDSVQLKDPAGNIISQVKLRSVLADQVMVLSKGVWQLSDAPTPGFSNDSAGRTAFVTGTASQSLPLQISEVLIANQMSLPDEKGVFSDVVELHNPTDGPVRLSGWCLSDSIQQRFRFRLPDITIDAGGYLVVYCDGESQPGENGSVHANFALTTQETLYLTDPTGAYITVKPQYGGDDISLALTEEGYKMMPSSLGFANTEEGSANAWQTRIDAESPLVISEVLTGDSAMPYRGAFVDAVELVNRSHQPVDTANWYLSDGSDPYAYALPAGVLQPGERTVIVLSQQSTGFALSAEETLYLMNPQYLYSQPVSCCGALPGYSISLVGEGNELTYDLAQVSLGFENTAAGAQSFQKSAAPQGLRINEAMSSNGAYLPGPYNNTTDWVELYNAGNTAVNLADYCLTDSQNLQQYPLPDQTLQPGGYVVILLSESGKNLREGYLWLSFSLSADGDRLHLTKQGIVEDTMILPELAGNTAWGRPAGECYYGQLSTPTPGRANSSVSRVSQRPVADIPQGSYNGVSGLTISFSGPGEIFYTTDCTTPNQASTRYTGPIQITKTTVFRVVAYEAGCTRSQVLDLTYLVNEGDTLTSVCLVTAPGNLWDYNSGIYVLGGNAEEAFPHKEANYWQNWEKSASVSLFETDGTLGFSEYCGLKIFGGFSRANNKKSFACMFRSKYGHSSLSYPLFGEEGIDTYQNFVLRAGGQNAYASKCLDEVITSLASDYLGLPVQRYRPVVLYLNGAYWGIYFIREKLNDQYVAGNFNTEASNVTISGWNGNLCPEYVALRNYARTHDLSDPECYAYVCSQINVENYMDYIIAQMWVANNDLGNVKFFKTNDLPWHWALFDTDLSMIAPNQNTVVMMLTKQNIFAHDPDSRVIIIRLLQNPEFKDAFLRRIAWQVKTVWNEEQVVARIDEFHDMLEKDMAKESGRWNPSVATWEKYIQRMRDFATTRNDYFIVHVQRFFKLTDQQMRDYGFEV